MTDISAQQKNVLSANPQVPWSPDKGLTAQTLKDIAKEWPTLGKHLDKFVVQYGKSDAGDDRQLEFYPPWETDNPNPGRPTIEIYRTDLGKEGTKSAIAGDALHYLGAVDPATNKPVDEKFVALKQQLRDSLTPKQIALDQRVHAEEGDGRSFEDWMNQSRTDAYIRGYLTPDKADEWRRQGTYTPDQTKILDAMRAHLEGSGDAVPTTDQPSNGQ